MEEFDSRDSQLTTVTLCDGRFRLLRHWLGKGVSRIYLAESTDSSQIRCLATVIPAAGVDGTRLTQRLGYRLPGQCELLAIGAVDHETLADDDLRDCLVMVERLPEGLGIARIRPKIKMPSIAIRLGIELGRTLLMASDAGEILADLQPATIFAHGKQGELSISGMSGRTRVFVSSRRPSCAAGYLLFERIYAAPEVLLGSTIICSSPTFPLAMLIAEWSTGLYPFPDASPYSSLHQLLMGQYRFGQMPARLADLLAQGLAREARGRIGLGPFIAALMALSQAELRESRRL